MQQQRPQRQKTKTEEVRKTDKRTQKKKRRKQQQSDRVKNIQSEIKQFSSEIDVNFPDLDEPWLTDVRQGDLNNKSSCSAASRSSSIRRHSDVF